MNTFEKILAFIVGLAFATCIMLMSDIAQDQPLQIDCNIVYSSRFEFPEYVYASCLNKDDRLCFVADNKIITLDEAIQLDYQTNDRVSIMRITESYQPIACN